jgi:hypothetical protein
VRDAAAPCYKIAVLALLYEKQKKAFSSKAINQLSEVVQEKQKIPQRLKHKTCLAKCE